jgi:hypothetical protein
MEVALNVSMIPIANGVLTMSFVINSLILVEINQVIISLLLAVRFTTFVKLIFPACAANTECNSCRETQGCKWCEMNSGNAAFCTNELCPGFYFEEFSLKFSRSCRC